MNTLKTLDATLDVLKYGGWQKNLFGSCEDPRQPHCMLGALLCAVEKTWDSPSVDSAVDALITAGKKVLGINYSVGLPTINDRHCDSFQDVEQIFDEAKKLAVAGS